MIRQRLTQSSTMHVNPRVPSTTSTIRLCAQTAYVRIVNTATWTSALSPQDGIDIRTNIWGQDDEDPPITEARPRTLSAPINLYQTSQLSQLAASAPPYNGPGRTTEPNCTHLSQHTPTSSQGNERRQCSPYFDPSFPDTASR